MILLLYRCDEQKGERFAETNDRSNEKDCQINNHKDYFSLYHNVQVSPIIIVGCLLVLHC